MNNEWRYKCATHGVQYETSADKPTVCQVDQVAEILEGSITFIKHTCTLRYKFNT